MGHGKWIFTAFLVGMIVGGLIGIITISTLISYKMDTYYEKIAELQHHIEDKDIRLKKLEESMNKQKVILKSIEVELLFEGNEIDQITLEKHVKEKYTKLVGKEVKYMDMDMIEEIIHKRIMKINSKEYQLLIYKIHLTDILKMWIEVKQIE
ncbi:MAG: hypothetical protein AB2421_09165 [Thermotaleaceae bacterium]